VQIASATTKAKSPFGGFFSLPIFIKTTSMAILPGQKAPAFTLYDTDKNPVTLEQQQGKNVLLLFFPLAWRIRRKGEPAGSGKWVWAAVMSGLCLWELNSFLNEPNAQTDSYDHPTVSAILNPLFQSAGVRAVVLTAWLGIGLWLARRFFVAPRAEDWPDPVSGASQSSQEE